MNFIHEPNTLINKKMLKSLYSFRENKILLNVDVDDFHGSRPEDLHGNLLVNAYVSFAIDFMCQKFDFS